MMFLGIWFLELHSVQLYMILKKSETSGGNPQKDILSKDIEFVRENVDQGQRLLILDPSRKTIKFFFSIGIMCIWRRPSFQF